MGKPVKTEDMAANTTLKRYRPTTGKTSLSSFMGDKQRKPLSNMKVNKAVANYMSTMRGK